MPTRNLGRTGYKVGIFSLGGQASIEKPNNFDIAVPIIERALDLGVNYIDTSSIYGGPDRWSEQYVGRVMATRRNEAFLATKTKERTREGSLRMIEKSLKLLNTDHVDLWQLHDVGLPEDVDAIFAKGGAMEALIEMHDQKVVRNLGVTGHYRPEALIGMKVPSRGRLLASWTPPSLDAQRHSWEGSAIAKRPGVMTMRDAMHFTLTHPVSTVIVGVDNLTQLEENVKIAHEFTPLSHAQMIALNAAAEPVAEQSLFFRFTDRSKG